MTTYKDLAGSYASSTGANLEIRSAISSKVVSFKGFLTNLSQDFKSNWATENVYGRMDPIATFQSTTRTVAVSLNVPAATVQEAVNNQIKFSKLSQMLYPAYLNTGTPTLQQSIPLEDGDQGAPQTIVAQEGSSGAKILAKSPLVRVKFGNLIRSQDGTQGLLGWIDGVSFAPTLGLGMFVRSNGEFYAKNYELSFTLNVLHEDDVGVDSATGEWLGGDGFPF